MFFNFPRPSLGWGDLRSVTLTTPPPDYQHRLQRKRSPAHQVVRHKEKAPPISRNHHRNHPHAWKKCPYPKPRFHIMDSPRYLNPYGTGSYTGNTSFFEVRPSTGHIKSDSSKVSLMTTQYNHLPLNYESDSPVDHSPYLSEPELRNPLKQGQQLISSGPLEMNGQQWRQHLSAGLPAPETQDSQPISRQADMMFYNGPWDHQHYDGLLMADGLPCQPWTSGVTGTGQSLENDIIIQGASPSDLTPPFAHQHYMAPAVASQNECDTKVVFNYPSPEPTPLPGPLSGNWAHDHRLEDSPPIHSAVTLQHQPYAIGRPQSGLVASSSPQLFTLMGQGDMNPYYELPGHPSGPILHVNDSSSKFPFRNSRVENLSDHSSNSSGSTSSTTTTTTSTAIMGGVETDSVMYCNSNHVVNTRPTTGRGRHSTSSITARRTSARRSRSSQNNDAAHTVSSGGGGSRGTHSLRHQHAHSKQGFLSPRDSSSDTDYSSGSGNHERSARDEFLLRSRSAGMTYKEIRHKGNFAEAESTLRGRFRTLTKDKDARVRKPEWQNNDVSHIYLNLTEIQLRPSIPSAFVSLESIYQGHIRCNKAKLKDMVSES